jgi:hypothetical protein
MVTKTIGIKSTDLEDGQIYQGRRAPQLHSRSQEVEGVQRSCVYLWGNLGWYRQGDWAGLA